MINLMMKMMMMMMMNEFDLTWRESEDCKDT